MAIIFALGNKMRNVMALWIVPMEVMKKAAVSENNFFSYYICFNFSAFQFHLLSVVPLIEVVVGLEKYRRY